MTPVQVVLKKVTEERVVSEHIETLKGPLPSPFWALAFLLPQVGFAFLRNSPFGYDRTGRIMSVGFIVFVAVSSIWALTKALRSRDRMWREVIRKEAPDLYAKIQSPNA